MRWESIASAQGGIIDRAQLQGLGVSDRRIDGMVARGELVVVLRSVYRGSSTPMTDVARRWAAVLWSGGVLSHVSAGAVWRVPVEPTFVVDVSVPDIGYRRSTRSWIRVHRVQLSLAECCRVEDLPLTDRRRTTVDLLGSLPLSQGRSLLGWALRERVLTVSDLDRRLVDGSGRSGNVRIRQLRREADPKAQAEFERRVQALLRERGIGGWWPQYPVQLASGQVIHADLAFPGRRLIIELDGWAWHGNGDRFRKDRRRWRGAVAAGWRVVQFTFDDLDAPDRMIAEILQLLAA